MKDLYTKSHILGSMFRNEHVSPQSIDFSYPQFEKKVEILHDQKVLILDKKEQTVTIGTIENERSYQLYFFQKLGRGFVNSYLLVLLAIKQLG
jgi:hypothetical protein